MVRFTRCGLHTTTVMALAACSGDPGARNPSDAATGDVAGERVVIRAAQGGRVRSADGLFELYVAPGAIARDTELSVRRVEASALSREVAAASPLSGVYAVEPDGLRFTGDGAYAVYRMPGAPAGLITTDVTGQRSYPALAAAAQPAAGGAVELQPATTTIYDADGGVRVLARLAHLSTQFVSTRARRSRLSFGVDFGARERSVGEEWLVPAAVALALAPENFIESSLIRPFINMQPLRGVLTRNVGDVTPVFSAREGDALRAPAFTITSWTTPVAGESVRVAPPMELFCLREDRGVRVYVGFGARVAERSPIGVPVPLTSEAAQVMVETTYDCIDRPVAPGDAGRDAPADARGDVTDLPEMDAGVGDVATDLPAPMDTVPADRAFDSPDAVTPDADAPDGATRDVGPDDGVMCASLFTRCGRDCADLSSDFDHCGACGNACPARPGARRLCRDYRCVNECLTDRGDCDGDPSNGCEAPLTTRLNCGGCGRMPVEVCDGVDNDCDGAVDETCPTTIVWPAGGYVGGTYGGPATGSDTTSNIWTGTSFNPLIGLCGAHNRDGTLRALRGVFSSVRLVTDRSTPEYTYSLQFTELDGMWTCESAAGGGTPGGTAFAIRCPPGTVADGIEGRADTHIGQVRLRCARLAVVATMGARATIRRVGTTFTESGGFGPGTPFSDTVPDDPATGQPGVLRSLRMQSRYGAAMSDGYILNLRPSGASPSLN